MNLSLCKIRVVLATLFTILVIVGCSNKVNTWGSRQYHMATTRWNVYFNGKESLRMGEELIAQNHKENFDRLLPIYFENNIDARNTAEANMERSVGKAVKAIELHSITAKPKRKRGKRESEKYREFRRKKEYNNMIDESYLLLGKAQFYRREYYSMERTFRYLLREYRGFDVYYEAAIWYARGLAEQDKYFRALRTIEDVMKEPEFPKELENMARAAKADMFIRRGAYKDAIEELEYLTKHTRKKEKQTRYYYLLAQLYTMQGEISKAQATFSDLIDTHPEYDYAFHAKLSKALLYEELGIKDGNKKVFSELRSLLRDGRNSEYLDQVYFTMGYLFEQEGKLAAAEENYLLSLEASVGNTKQKAQTLLALGDYYFDKKKDYANAQKRYSEAAGIITEDYPNYEEISTRLESLTLLAENLRTVADQDSLRHIASMPKLEMERYIQNLLLEDHKSSNKKTRKERKLYQAKLRTIDRPIGEWYFYNPLAVEQGKRAFQKEWGAIVLTDNWRSRKEPELLRGTEETKEQNEEEVRLATFEDYVKNLPLTEEQRKKSEDKSIDALYDVGVIYEDELEDYIEAIRAFEQVLEREPENQEKILRTNYHLFLLNSLLDNNEKASYYKNIVINKFPESAYAKVLQDPAYYAKLEQKGKDAEILYEKAYLAYDKKDFEQVKQLTDRGIDEFRETAAFQRFVFLNAMAKGYTESSDVFKDALLAVKKIVIDKRIAEATDKMLSQLAQGVKPNQEQGKIKRDWKAEDFEESVNHEIKESRELKAIEKIEIPKNYKMEENVPHFFAMVLPRDIKAGIEKSIEHFNEDRYAKKNLRVRRRNFSLNTDIILVEALANRSEALAYFGQIVIKQKDFMKGINEVDYDNFIITERNLLKLTADRKLTPYLDFYSYFYLGEGQKETQEEEVENPKSKIEEQQVAIENLQPTVSFAYDAKEEHHFVLIVPSKGVDVNYLWTALHHFDEKYRVKKEKLGRKRMLIVEKIGDKEKAMEYIKNIVQIDYIYNNLKDVEYRNFIISNDNLELLRSTKATDNYIQFFKDNYLK